MKRVRFIQKLSFAAVAALLLTGGLLTQMASAATPSFKQSKAIEVNSGSTANIALSSSVVAGDLIAVEVLWSNTGSVTVSDNRGDVFAAANTRSTWGSNWSAQVFYAKNVTGGTTTVTTTFATSLSNFAIVQAHEYAGVDKTNPLDGASSGVGTNTTAASGNVTTTGSNDLLFAAGGALGALSAPPTGWTARLNTSGNRTADKVAASAGTQNVAITASGNQWVMQLVAFKADSGVDTTAPSAPASLTATATSSSQINLSWPAATDNVGVTSYQVERCQGASCSTFALLATTPGTTTSYSDTSLSASTLYRYRVRAVDAAGNLGAYSPVAQATTQTPADTVAPSVPTDLTGAGMSVSQTSLSWTASTDNTAVTGYKVFRGGVQIGATAGTSYNDSGLTANTGYSYTVSAYDAAGNNSAQSAAANVSTLADVAAPTVPGSFTVQVISSSQINLLWAASTDNVGVASYKVYRDGSLVATPATAAVYQDISLAPGTTYSYTVSAVDTAGNESAQTAAAQATTTPVDVTAPTVAVTTPTDAGMVSGTVTVTASASDSGSGVHDVKFYVEGTLAATDTSAPYSFQWNTTSLANGTYSLTAVATDNASNVSTASTTVTVTVNNTVVTPSTLKIMPLGDSLTQGGVTAGMAGLDPSTVNGYRLELKNLLTTAGYTIDYVGSVQVGNALLSDQDENGFSGACIMVSPCGGGTLYPQTAGWLNTYTPDLVIMQGGENDFSGGISETQDAANMQAWIQLVWTTLPNAKIIVTGVPWHTDYPGSYGDLVHSYVDGLQAQGKPIRWVPYGENIGRSDGTHPSAAGYITWANELAPMVQQLFPQ